MTYVFGNLGKTIDDCAADDHDCLEEVHCPSATSSLPWPIGDEDCRTFKRFRRRGMLTTTEQLELQRRHRERAAQRAQDAERAKEEEAARQRARLQQAEKYETAASKAIAADAKVQKNKQIIIVIAVVILILGIGARFLIQV